MYPDVSECDNSNATKHSLAAPLPVHTMYPETDVQVVQIILNPFSFSTVL